ncbi:MAG: hypothetical protein IT565_07860, partial [Rhodospirillales bacterium]|nr:hypothetical protein [Rhodospirillales bacterium]
QGASPYDPRSRLASQRPGEKGAGRLSEEAQQVVDKLRKRDAEVRAHEQAHVTAGGPYAGAPSFTTTRGPDGQLYAIAGEVPIDVSPVASNPEATVRKMEQVKRAALAPSQPSSADRAVAAQAQAILLDAQSEAREAREMEKDGKGGEGVSGVANNNSHAMDVNKSKVAPFDKSEAEAGDATARRKAFGAYQAVITALGGAG